MKVLFVTAELYPVVKTGGLADVSYSLPKALKKSGEDIRILIPAYRGVKEQLKNRKKTIDIGEFFGFGKCTLILGEMPSSDVPVYIIDCPKAFDRKGTPYGPNYHKGWKDNHKRFALLSKVAALIASGDFNGWAPDVVHCQDWHSGLAPMYISEIGMKNPPKTICTIHNIMYAGCFKAKLLSKIKVNMENKNRMGKEFSFLKTGIMCSDVVTTVSPGHARELTFFKYGKALAGILKTRYDKDELKGILNGIDPKLWNPQDNTIIHKQFGANNIEDKLKNKLELQKHMGVEINPDIPLVVLLSRLDYQKGTDVFAKSIDKIVSRGAQVIIHGKGFPDIEKMMEAAQKKYPGRVCAKVGFDGDLEHKIYAGGDIFIAPSDYEPCGLSQMYAMLYGCVPVVRNTGGLADTVKDVSENGNGFVFEKLNVTDICEGLFRAIDLYNGNRVKWDKLVKKNMKQDFSWDKIVRQYIKLYKEI